MYRLGKYTGRIYKDDEIKNMKECGVCISDEEAKDEDFIDTLKKRNSIDCFLCGGSCPESLKEK